MQQVVIYDMIAELFLLLRSVYTIFLYYNIYPEFNSKAKMTLRNLRNNVEKFKQFLLCSKEYEAKAQLPLSTQGSYNATDTAQAQVKIHRVSVSTISSSITE